MVDEEGKETPKASPPETPPPIITQVRRREGRQWTMLLIYMLIALIVAAGVVLGGRWIYNSVRDNEPAKETATTTERTVEPPAATAPNQSGAAPQAPSNQPSPTPTPSTARQGDELADTGPGEVIALFIAATVAASGLHYIISLRRREV